MKAIYYGHSTFLFDIGGYKVLIDPFITPNDLAKDKVDIDEINCDYILLTHGHEDHMADLESIAKNTDATLICSWEAMQWFNKRGLEKIHPMNIGGKWSFEFGTVITTQAVHSSSFPDGMYAGAAMGFIINNDQLTFYYAGDTALFLDMQLIKEIYRPSIAFLPIGDNFTMDITNAMRAAQFVGVSKVIAMHFDTFPYIKIDHKEALIIAEQAGIELIIPEIGEIIDI